MEYRQLGSSGLQVSRLALGDDNLGCWNVRLTPDAIARIEAPGALAPEYPGAFIETFRQWMRRVRHGS